MVQIQPVQIWVNGEVKNAEYFALNCINDNLKDNALFYFELLTTDLIAATAGNINLVGIDYENYNTSTDSNTFAYDCCTAKLNLTIIKL